jgi:hypothetical protein
MDARDKRRHDESGTRRSFLQKLGPDPRPAPQRPPASRPNLGGSASRFGQGVKVALTVRRVLGEAHTGESTMARVINEILLFSCMAAFVTGIVIAAASLLS